MPHACHGKALVRAMSMLIQTAGNENMSAMEITKNMNLMERAMLLFAMQNRPGRDEAGASLQKWILISAAVVVAAICGLVFVGFVAVGFTSGMLIVIRSSSGPAHNCWNFSQ